MENKSLRYESKFVTSELDSKEVLHLIKHNPLMFSEIFSERRVNNIYFDSIGFKDYHENLAGNSDRLKVRVRWYGNIFGAIKKPRLELKIKQNQLGRKLSFPLKTFVLDKDFSLNLLQKVFSESNLPIWLIEKLKFYHLVLLNSYERKYFLSSNKNYRITLDKNLSFFEIRDINNSFNIKFSDKDKQILEIKYLVKNCKEVSNITKNLPFRLVSCSKYIQGVDLMLS